MNKFVVSIISVVALIAVTAALTFYYVKKTGEKSIHATSNIIVENIEKMGKLQVVKFNIRDVVEYTEIRTLLPNSKTVLIITGEVAGCVDLTKLTTENVYTKADSISITLPKPEICYAKIDHSRSKVYNVQYGLWNTANLVDEAYKFAEQQLYVEAMKMGLYQESEQNTRLVLTPMLNLLGFTKVNIEFI